jgi:hypothetical protein
VLLTPSSMPWQQQPTAGEPVHPQAVMEGVPRPDRNSAGLGSAAPQWQQHTQTASKLTWHTPASLRAKTTADAAQATIQASYSPVKPANLGSAFDREAHHTSKEVPLHEQHIYSGMHDLPL